MKIVTFLRNISVRTSLGFSALTILFALLQTALPNPESYVLTFSSVLICLLFSFLLALIIELAKLIKIPVLRAVIIFIAAYADFFFCFFVLKGRVSMVSEIIFMSLFFIAAYFVILIAVAIKNGIKARIESKNNHESILGDNGENE